VHKWERAKFTTVSTKNFGKELPSNVFYSRVHDLRGQLANFLLCGFPFRHAVAVWCFGVFSCANCVSVCYLLPGATSHFWVGLIWYPEDTR
jgi:hypothetical protein